ncbi:hypothetical protein LRAMOSA11344 [Lichtheimia ramosa]|uniref:Uncharacterized protein n=1 Tax=Lichtheimia ramosa TaxID=688394 RepID=A0A077WUY8_9FUNG|nr:hypothetical protein LRAMOSA11344 [Lichtheimia ramosa]
MSNGIQSVDQQFNITSPLDHGVYVAAQKLPITYVLLGDSSGLELNIYMKPVDVNATTVVVAQKADVSEDASSIVTIDNKTYWQHSYNYEIPRSTQAGSYEVVFESVNSQENTSVPITIRPYVSTSAPGPLPTGSSSASASPSPGDGESSSASRKVNICAALAGFVMLSSFLL